VPSLRRSWRFRLILHHHAVIDSGNGHTCQHAPRDAIRNVVLRHIARSILGAEHVTKNDRDINTLCHQVISSSHLVIVKEIASRGMRICRLWQLLPITRPSAAQQIMSIMTCVFIQYNCSESICPPRAGHHRSTFITAATNSLSPLAMPPKTQRSVPSDIAASALSAAAQALHLCAEAVEALDARVAFLESALNAVYGIRQAPALKIEQLAVECRSSVDTATAAHLMGLEPKTLRTWARNANGPMTPIRERGRIKWSTAEIRKLVTPG